jgi:glucuronoarabinoxylan endo-1,4-beta-xylanase
MVKNGLKSSADITITLSALITFAAFIVASAQTCIVDWNNLHQRIDGFGGGVVFMNPASLDPVTDSNMDTLFGTNYADELGLTLLRIRIDPATNWTDALLDAQKAVARGAGVLATPWTPPVGMKSNTNAIGGYLLPSQYTNYANYLNYFAGYMAAHGAPLKAISIQNEPDFVPTTYEGCGWTPAQLQTFCHDVGGLITNAPLIMPESASYNQSMSDPTLNDPVAAANVTYIGEHLYGPNNTAVPIVDYPNAHDNGKDTWMTEYLVNDQTIGTAITTAKQIHDCLTIGNFSAYIWWHCLEDANGLVNASGVPQPRGFVMAQWSRFVRPGYYRIDTSASADSAFITAFKDTNSDRFAIVAVNTNTSTSITQTFNLSNFPAVSSVTPWITSATMSLSNQTPVAVSGSSFTYTLPPMSVVTFAGQGDVMPSSITISDVSYDPAASAFVLTWNSTEGATYSVFKTNVLSGSDLNWPAIVTGYPAGGAAGGPLSYTDTTATVSPAFYKVSSP